MNKCIFISLFFLCSCIPHRYCPDKPFAEFETPEAPDYSTVKDWASHPEIKDWADTVPIPALKDKQLTAKADLFFIHPTTYNSEKSWNADLSDSILNHDTDTRPILHQASIFNVACKVYAPRYRQVTLGAFWSEDKESTKAALDVAYSDVKSAFEYYLANLNQGRPIVIASHSQGSVHAIRLIKEFFDEKPLSQKLVAAYIVGWSVEASSFKAIPPCSDPTGNECFASWSSFAWGYEEEVKWHRNAMVVNPVTWTLDSAASEINEHQGLVLARYNSILPEKVYVKSHHGLLWVSKPDIQGKFLITSKNYHVADYNIFWMDVRNNVELRVTEWLKKNI